MKRYKPFCLVALLVALAVIMASRYVGRAMRYDFPAGFKGWVAVQFNNNKCPPLRRSGIWFVVDVPSSGRVCTSTNHDSRWVYYRFEYVSRDGGTRKIPMRTGSDASGQIEVRMITYIPSHNWEELFVGTKEDANGNWGLPPDPMQYGGDLAGVPTNR